MMQGKDIAKPSNALNSPTVFVDLLIIERALLVLQVPVGTKLYGLMPASRHSFIPSRIRNAMKHRSQ